MKTENCVLEAPACPRCGRVMITYHCVFQGKDVGGWCCENCEESAGGEPYEKEIEEEAIHAVPEKG